jgi:magnesium-transporting ATPase (P-type)
MVSGDHIETAKQIAKQVGILKKEDEVRDYSVLLPSEFRELCGGLITHKNPETEELEFDVQNRKTFEDVARNLKVLARATAQDKLLLIVGLKGMGHQISVTGDGINDVEALKNADVGLAMGSGCSAVKEVADMILTDNDFEANIRAVMWGRNIFNNITRFLQFQITVNISVVITVFVGVILFGESPLTAVQLLWVNLIMDTFAALALSTEPPNE